MLISTTPEQDGKLKYFLTRRWICLGRKIGLKLIQSVYPKWGQTLTLGTTGLEVFRLVQVSWFHAN